MNEIRTPFTMVICIFIVMKPFSLHRVTKSYEKLQKVSKGYKNYRKVTNGYKFSKSLTRAGPKN